MPVSGAYIPIFGVWDTFRYIVTCMMHKRHMSLTLVPVAGNGHTPVCSLKALHTWFKSIFQIMTWLYANQIDNKPSKWIWCWCLIRKTNDPDCNVVKLMMLLIESNPNARENSVQIRKTNDPDWNVVKSRMSLFQGVVKVRENSVFVYLLGVDSWFISIRQLYWYENQYL